jgi:hypothetical protein
MTRLLAWPIALLLGLMVLPAAALADPVARAASATTAGRGSSCAHPYKATFKAEGHGAFGGNQNRIQMGAYTGSRWRVEWSLKSGEVICSARIQLRNGSLVQPTRMIPYPTPTPTGGEYAEPHHARSALSSIVVTYAKSPVRAGSSCDYPLESRWTSQGQGGNTGDFSVGIKGYNPNLALNTPQRVWLEVTLNNERVAICPQATIEVFTHTQAEIDNETPGPGTLHRYSVSMKPEGGDSSTVTVQEQVTAADVYGRLVR